MKESVLDILIYLFENYFDGELEDGFEPDRDTLTQELEHAGFPTAEVERALPGSRSSRRTRAARSSRRTAARSASSTRSSRRGSTPTVAAISSTSSTSGSCRPPSASV